MLTKPRLLLSLSKKIGFFYKSENNDNGNNAKDYSHNHANNHKNYDNKMNRGPFVFQKRKRQDGFLFLPLFCFAFFSRCRNKVLYIYIYIYSAISAYSIFDRLRLILHHPR